MVYSSQHLDQDILVCGLHQTIVSLFLRFRLDFHKTEHPNLEGEVGIVIDNYATFHQVNLCKGFDPRGCMKNIDEPKADSINLA